MLLVLLAGCAHTSPPPDPDWLLAGSGARTDDGHRRLHAIAFVRVPPGLEAGPEALRKRRDYVTLKQARRLVVRMREAAVRQPYRSVAVLGEGEAAETLERLANRLMSQSTTIGRFRGEDGVYVGFVMDIDAFIAQLGERQPDVARWMSDGFKTLESEDSTTFLRGR